MPYRSFQTKEEYDRAIRIAYDGGARDTEALFAEVRPEVRRFGMLMERVLRDNDHKGGWDRETARSLLERLKQEVRELSEAIAAMPTPCHCRSVGDCPHGMFGPTREEVAREAADVANFAMMIVDVFGELPNEVTAPAGRRV